MPSVDKRRHSHNFISGFRFPLHPGLDEVPIAILLQTVSLTGAWVGNDPIDRRPGSGGHPGRAIPYGMSPQFTDPR
jgi:hypothetical protein